MVYEYVIVGCGVSGLMSASMIKEKTDNFLILEKEKGFGGVWESVAKGQTCLQHNSSMYLLDSFFYVPGESLPEMYADTGTIMNRLKKFIKYKELNKHIRYNIKVNNFYEDDDIITIKIQHDGEEKEIQCKYLFICTGNLSIPKKMDYSNKKMINYAHIKDYDKYFKGKKNILVIGAGASGVEVCNNAIRCGVKDITMVYNNHLGLYFNNFFTEYLFTIIHLLPRLLAHNLYIMIQHLIAWIYGLKLPPYIGYEERFYPFSSAMIKAYNEGRVKIVKCNSDGKPDEKLVKKADGIIETVGFDNSLGQFGLNAKDLYNLNTRHGDYDNVFFVGLNKGNTGTTPYSNYFMLKGIFYLIETDALHRKSLVDDIIYTPLLFIRYFIDMKIGLRPMFSFMWLWIYGFYVRLVHHAGLTDLFRHTPLSKLF